MSSTEKTYQLVALDPASASAASGTSSDASFTDLKAKIAEFESRLATLDDEHGAQSVPHQTQPSRGPTKAYIVDLEKKLLALESGSAVYDTAAQPLPEDDALTASLKQGSESYKESLVGTVPVFISPEHVQEIRRHLDVDATAQPVIDAEIYPETLKQLQEMNGVKHGYKDHPMYSKYTVKDLREKFGLKPTYEDLEAQLKIAHRRINLSRELVENIRKACRAYTILVLIVSLAYGLAILTISLMSNKDGVDTV